MRKTKGDTDVVGNLAGGKLNIQFDIPDSIQYLRLCCPQNIPIFNFPVLPKFLSSKPQQSGLLT